MPNQPAPGDSTAPPHRPPPGRRPPGGQPTPHDSVFRRIFGVPANAASQLRAVLPADLAARLDLGQLAPVPASFVDEALKWRYSDLLFTVPMEGRDAFVYVLVEHQSSSDPLMAFRMLRYMTRIWDAYLREHPEARRLPAVIPLVVHHGSRPWDGPVQLADLLDLDPGAVGAAGRYLPRFEFLLDDLPGVGEQQLRDRPLTAPAQITLLLLKIAAGNPRLVADLAPWAGQLRSIAGQPGGTETLVALLTYIERVSEVPVGELHDLAASLGPEAKEAYVTTAEMLQAEGAAKGAAETKAQDVLKVIDARNLRPTREQRAMVTGDAGLDKLNRWFDRALTAATAADVFKGDED
ncbi:MAG: Rpn family recombination-promoting nuclease/putative transposase [Streptosporangiaceae bacterium]